MQDWSKINGAALRKGLGIHAKRQTCMDDLASIAAIEKTWTHRFIDKHARLRWFFAKVSTIEFCLQTRTAPSACALN
jgi:hypothetical protein